MSQHNLKKQISNTKAPIKFSGRSPQVAATVPTMRVAQPNGKRPKVMVCIPSGRTWEARTSTCVTGMAAYSAINGIDLGIINLEGSMITKQRNDLVNMAKKNGGTHVLFVDSDLLFPADALVRLLNHNKDVVGATYNKRVPPYETLGRLRGNKDDAAKGGLVEAELLPGGFMLFKIEVFDRIPWPWYYETYQWPGSTGVESFREMLMSSFCQYPPQAVLDCIQGTPLGEWLDHIHKIESAAAGPGNRWDYMSEDLNFCRKLVKAGIKIYCDLDLTFQLTHLGTLEVHCKNPEAEKPAEEPAKLASV